MMVTKKASDLNSLLSSNKVSLLTREQTPGPDVQRILEVQTREKLIALTGALGGT